jgi:hypothetical protein
MPGYEHKVDPATRRLARLALAKRASGGPAPPPPYVPFPFPALPPPILQEEPRKDWQGPLSELETAARAEQIRQYIEQEHAIVALSAAQGGGGGQGYHYQGEQCSFAATATATGGGYGYHYQPQQSGQYSSTPTVGYHYQTPQTLQPSFVSATGPHHFHSHFHEAEIIQSAYMSFAATGYLACWQDGMFDGIDFNAQIGSDEYEDMMDVVEEFCDIYFPQAQTETECVEYFFTTAAACSATSLISVSTTAPTAPTAVSVVVDTASDLWAPAPRVHVSVAWF